jgi:uncharacterized protein YjcR
METEKIDARKISTQAQQEKRDIAMRLRDAGMENIEVAKIVGVHHYTVSQWYSKYKRDKSLIKIRVLLLNGLKSIKIKYFKLYE